MRGRTVSDDEGGFTYRPAGGRRRVSMFVAVPVVAGCAALGTIAGVIVPMRSPGGPAVERASQAQTASRQPAGRMPSAADAEPTAVAIPAPPAAPGSGGVAPVPVKEVVPSPPPRPVPQPVRTISEEELLVSPPKSPAIETGSVDHRPTPADDARAPVTHSKREASQGEPVPAETSARSEGRARRMRAKRVRRVYVQQPQPQAAPPSQAGVMAPPSQNSYTSLVPPQ